MVDDEFVPMILGAISCFCIFMMYGPDVSKGVFFLVAFVLSLTGFVKGVSFLKRGVRGNHVIAGTILSGIFPALVVGITVYINIVGYH